MYSAHGDAAPLSSSAMIHNASCSYHGAFCQYCIGVCVCARARACACVCVCVCVCVVVCCP